MTIHLRPCAHIARTNALRISGNLSLILDSGRVSGTPGLRFRTIADMMPLTWHDEQGTANAVGCNDPPGFKSPILRFGLPTELPVSYRQNCFGGLF